MCGVGGGGKTLFGEQRRERFKETLLVLFDRQQVIATLLIKNLFYRFHRERVKPEIGPREERMHFNLRFDPFSFSA